MYANDIRELITLSGSFPLLCGKPTKKEDGYFYSANGIEIEISLKEHPSGITSRCDKIKNVSSEPITLDCAMSKFTYNSGEYEVYTQYSEWCGEGHGTWQRLNTDICAGTDDLRMNCSSNPFVALKNLQNSRGIAFHIMAKSTWTIRVHKGFAQRNGTYKVVSVELGINEHSFNYTIAPHECLELPEILYYSFSDTKNMDAYKLHRYANDIYPARTLPIIYNSWMSHFDNIGFEILSEQLKLACELGCEYFVVDAGWFGTPNEWFGRVGDWKECTEFSFKGRMKEFADSVRAYGMKFGLWFEIERASARAEAVKLHPEHYISEGGNYFVDFSSEKACEYIFEILADNIKKYGIEFIKFDFNAEITYDPKHHAFIDYFRGYEGFLKRIRTEYPNVYLECCASGGLRMAMGNIGNFDSFWMSDNHSLYKQLDIYKNTILRMPSRVLETWITVASAEKFRGDNVEKILVSGDACWGHIEAVDREYLLASSIGGPIGISCDLTTLSKKLRANLRDFITIYKAERDFWINSECRILCDTETMTVLQFNDIDFNEIKLYVYTKAPEQNAIDIYPICDLSSNYICSSSENTVSGKELNKNGVCLKINGRYTANSVVLKKM